MFVCVGGATEAVRIRLRRWLAQAWPDGVEQVCGELLLLTDGRRQSSVHEVGQSSVGCIDGVVWSGEGGAEGAMLRSMAAGRWPLPLGLDGSYAALVVDTERSTVRVDLDPIGVRRVFMGGAPGAWVVSSLQAPAAIALGLTPDAVGIAQVLGMNYSLGRRTLFEGLEELLPGESWEFSNTGRRLLGWEPAMVDDGDADTPIEIAAENLAERYLRSFDEFARGRETVGLALSGGIDSRLVLGGLLAVGCEPCLFSWGQPDEYESQIVTRCAAAVGLPIDRLDLSTHLFPLEPESRAFSLANEALLHPAWVGLEPLFRERGVEVVALGNVTDSFQVRIGGMWSRRARLTRGARRLLGRPQGDPALSPGYRSVDEWWSQRLARETEKVKSAALRFGIDVSEDEICRSTSDDLDGARTRLSVAPLGEAVRFEDALHLLTCRQVHGSQPQAVSGIATGIDLTASRNLGRAALSLSPVLRADRALIDALARRLLPKELARIPTATIPVIPANGHWALQYLVWGGRFAGDQGMRWVNAKLGGRLSRDRLFRTLDLYSAYRLAGGRHYLAGDWGRSGLFDTSPFRDEFLAVVGGAGLRPMYPFRIHLALRLDTMLSCVATTSA